MNDHVFTVTGMSCAHCERAIVQSVRALDPNATVHVDRTTQQVRIQHTQQPAERLVAAITEEGYTVVATQP